MALENTLRAFELAIEHRLDMAELDVHLARDGQLVVVHDADLARLFGRAEQVADLTTAELGAAGVPSLAEVLAVARGCLGLYVELKGPGTGTALGALVASGAASNVALIGGSFEPALVHDLRAANPTIPRSVLFGRASVAEMIDVCRALQARYAHPCFRPITAAIVDGLHDADLLVMTPHTNDPAEAREFAVLGVDVIASDDPRVLRPLVSAA